MIEYIPSAKAPLAIIVRAHQFQAGVNFLTPGEYSQQLATMSHPAGTRIDPHTHRRVSREILYTQEILVIQKGRLRVDFYDQQKNYLESRIVQAGDIVQLISGGHGFQVLDDLNMLEIKQGPYVGDADKERFDGVSSKEVRVEK